MKPTYRIEIRQSLQGGQWVVTLYDGAAIVRSATCPSTEERSARKIYKLWREQFKAKEKK